MAQAYNFVAMRSRTIIVCLLLAGCAQAPVLPPTAELFRDELFAAPSQPIDASEIFALSEPMQRYLEVEVETGIRAKGVRQALIDAVTQGRLKLKYDSETTRTAAQAFEARAGKRGLAAMEAGDYPAARALFQKELDRVPDYHEFHFWLGLAELQLGNVPGARAQVAAALENSTTRHDHDLYAAKLQRLAALQR
jgi:tetratricopeptide (TPR) repeat protein